MVFMNIEMAPQSELAKWVLYMGSELKKVTYDQAISCCVGLEGAFYTTLNSHSFNSFKLIQSIRKISATHIHELQLAFNLLNIGSVFLCSKKIIEEIQKRYSFTPLEDPFASNFLPFAISSSVFAVGHLILKRYQKYPVRKEAEVEISENPSFQQKFAQRLHITQLVLNIALACLVQNRFWLVLNVIGSSYNYLKNSQLKWLNFSKTFNVALPARNWQNFLPGAFNAQLRISKVKITYNMLSLSSKSVPTEENCSICLDSNPDTRFCTSHWYHQACLIDLVKTKSNVFANKTSYQRTSTRHYTNGVYTHTSHAYNVDIPQDNLPSCPNCRDFPPQNDCEILVSDEDYGDFQANVHIVRPSSSNQAIFEKIYTAYNTAQAGLTYLQQYPELTAAIFKIQKFLLVTDLLGLACTTYFLYDKIQAKFDLTTNKAKALLAISTIALAALSYLAVLQINLYLKPAILLKDVLGNLKVSPLIPQDIDISWESPLIHKFMQVVYINRIMASFALSFFSSHRKLNLASAAAQSLSLLGIANLRWIQVVQTLNFPLGKIASMGGKLSSSVGIGSLRELKVTSYFLTYPNCSNIPSHLQSTVKSIYDYINTLFHNSSWNRYWMINTQNGVETSRNLHYEISLQNNPISSCACTLKPYLESIGMQAVDAFYGRANVDLTYAL